MLLVGYKVGVCVSLAVYKVGDECHWLVIRCPRVTGWA